MKVDSIRNSCNVLFLLRWDVQRISPWPFPICRVLMKNWPKNFDIDISILIMTKGFCSWKCWYIDINVHIKIDKGSCTYYVIMDGGRSLQMITVLHVGCLAKWLQYYIGVGRHMITVLHRGGLANDYGITWILVYYIRIVISRHMGPRRLYSYVLWCESTLYPPFMKNSGLTKWTQNLR